MSNLNLLESIIKNLDAKETRTTIMLANDRLSALGESPVQESKKQPSGKSHGGYKKRGASRDYNVKGLPLALGDFVDDVGTKVHKTFRDLSLNWVNLEPKPTVADGSLVILTVGKKFAQKMYMWGMVKDGLANFNANGVDVPNFFNLTHLSFKDVDILNKLSSMSTTGEYDLQKCIDDMKRYRDLP